MFLSYDSNALITANDRILAHQAGPEPELGFYYVMNLGNLRNFTPCLFNPNLF